MNNDEKIIKLLENLTTSVSQIQSDITEIKGKVNSVYEQTAELTEFRTETKDGFSLVSKDIKFIKHKLRETEEDVFDIKDHFKLIK